MHSLSTAVVCSIERKRNTEKKRINTQSSCTLFHLFSFSLRCMFNEVIRHSGDIKMVVWYLKLEWNVLNCIHNNGRVCVCVCDANVNTAQQIARWRQWNKQVINPKYYNNTTTTTASINITTIKKKRMKTGCKRKKVAERQFLANNIVDTTFFSRFFRTTFSSASASSTSSSFPY